MTQAVLQKYQTQQIMSASPAKLVAMLIDKAIACLTEAGAAIERGDIAGRHNANRKAIDIVAHLWGTLDLDRGREIAANLDRLYAFMMRRLGDVDMKNEAQAARDVIGLLDPLRKSWHELASQPAGQAAPDRAAAPAPSPAPSPAPAPTPAPTPAPAPSAAASMDAPTAPEGPVSTLTISA